MNSENIRRSSVALLEKWGLPVLRLPLLERVSKVRDQRTVVNRLMCQFALGGVADPRVARPKLLAWLESEGAANELEPIERGLLERASLSQAEINEASWKPEAALTLAWAGTVVDSLPPPTKQARPECFFPLIPPEVPTAEFRRRFRLRLVDEIAEWLDVYYLTHAALKHPEAWTSNHRSPSELNICVVDERRLALEWLVDPDTLWSEITLDT